MAFRRFAALALLVFSVVALMGWGCNGNDNTPQAADIQLPEAGIPKFDGTVPDTAAPPPPGQTTPSTYAVGGNVVNLLGAGLTLQINNGETLPITQNGHFQFPTKLPVGQVFQVTVSRQPESPNQVCSVSGGLGQVGNADVTSIVVNCATDKFTVGGIVLGLAGTLQLVNTVNGVADTVTITANGTFAFPTPVDDGTSWNVAVRAQPKQPSQTCVVTAGATGTIQGADTLAVRVQCTTNQYAVGGTVNGLQGTLILANNGAPQPAISGDGPFSLGTMPSGSSYNVTVANQPNGETCTVQRGVGSVQDAPVNNINVFCSSQLFTVGGTLSGLPQGTTIVLSNNGTDTLNLTANGTFAFNGQLPGGSSYRVVVKTQPPNTQCAVSNGSGVMPNANVTNVSVTCVPLPTRTFFPGTQPWIDACAGADGTALAGSDDGSTPDITLPFNVSWFGETHSTASISSNGVVWFTDGLVVNPNQEGPSPAAAFPMGQDLYQRCGVCWKTVGTAPNRQWVAEWNDTFIYHDLYTGAPIQGCGDAGIGFGVAGNTFATPAHLTFELMFNESGSMDFVYHQMQLGTGGAETFSIGANNSGNSLSVIYYQSPDGFGGLSFPPEITTTDYNLHFIP